MINGRRLAVSQCTIDTLVNTFAMLIFPLMLFIDIHSGRCVNVQWFIKTMHKDRWSAM